MIGIIHGGVFEVMTLGNAMLAEDGRICVLFILRCDCQACQPSAANQNWRP